MARRALPCRHAVGADGAGAVAVAFAQVAHGAGQLALLDDALALGVVFVLDQVDDRVDGLGVDVALGQHQLLLDHGVVVLDGADVAGLVLADDEVVGLDHAPRRRDALGLDHRRVVDLPRGLHHLLGVVLLRRRAFTAVVDGAAAVLGGGRRRGGREPEGEQRPERDCEALHLTLLVSARTGSARVEVGSEPWAEPPVGRLTVAGA